MKCTRLTLLAIGSLLLAASAAPADMMTFDGVALSRNVQIHCPGLLSDGVTVRAGKYNVTYQQTPFEVFCVDANHWAGDTEVTEVGIDSLRNGDLVACLYETHASAADTHTRAAALSVAIWEVLYENEDDFNAGSGHFHVTGNGDVVLAANDMLAGLPDFYQPTMNLVILHSEEKQDMIIGTLGEVPEPATLTILALGGLLTLFRQRRRARA